MTYYPEPDCHIRDKVKVILDSSNYATEKELDHDTGVDISDWAAKKDFTALKTEVDKLNINILVNVPTSRWYLTVGKLRIFPVDSKKLFDVVDNEVVKNTKFITLNTKVNNLDKKVWCNYFNSHKSIQYR